MTGEPTTFCLIDSATFFSERYHLVSGELATFAACVAKLARSPDNADHRATLAASAQQIMLEAYAVCSITPPAPTGSGQSAFIVSVVDLVAALNRSADATALRCAHELQIHADYICDKVAFGSDTTSLADEHAAYFRDFAVTVVALLCRFVFSQYKWKSADPRLITEFFDVASAEARMSARVRDVIGQSAERLEGWCSSGKAAMLFSLVRDFKPSNAVEIGIYGGRSIVPIALALQENRTGTVIGIETWTAAASTKFRTSIANDFHWSIADYYPIKRNFFRFALEHELFDVIKVVEASSDRASGLLDDIDFIHIDGGHSAFGAAQDIVTYVSKVRTGGVIVFDDIDWETTAPGVEILRDSCQLLHVVPSFGQTNVPGCAAFRKL